MAVNDDIITSPPQSSDREVSINIEKVVKHEEDMLNAHGVFPVMMASVNNYIQEEHRSRRITGKEYAQVYLSMLQTTLSEAVRWGLSVDKVNRDLALQHQQILSLKLENEQLVAKLDLEREILHKQLERSNKEMESIDAKIKTDDIINAQLSDKLALERDVLTSKINNDSKQRQMLDQDIAYKATTNAQLNTELQLKRDVISRQILMSDYERTYIKPQELLNMQTNKLLLDQQILLTGEKAKTETQNIQVSYRQALLYEQQAKAFKFKHNRELANDLINNYVMAQTQSVNVSFGSTVYGHNLTDNIQNALWV